MPESLYQPKVFRVRRPGDFETDDPIFEGFEAEREALMEADKRHKKEWTQPWGVYQTGDFFDPKWLFFLGCQYERTGM